MCVSRGQSRLKWQYLYGKSISGYVLLIHFRIVYPASHASFIPTPKPHINVCFFLQINSQKIVFTGIFARCECIFIWFSHIFGHHHVDLLNRRLEVDFVLFHLYIWERESDFGLDLSYIWYICEQQNPHHSKEF